MRRIDLTLVDQMPVKISEDGQGLYFMLDKYRASLPPHVRAVSLNPHEVLTFFVEQANLIGDGVISILIYDWIKKGHVKNPLVNSRPVSSEEEMHMALQGKIIDENSEKKDLQDRREADELTTE